MGFVLTCLAAFAGYIRADEATRGYYTNWLRALAAAGVGASGVLIYQLLA
jgi:transposase